uniref:Uncharacterized protein n=1 Tax=Oryza barthii TaxID=65489 RepID=A0A0D3HBC0_9ORYZ
MVQWLSGTAAYSGVCSFFVFFCSSSFLGSASFLCPLRFAVAIMAAGVGLPSGTMLVCSTWLVHGLVARRVVLAWPWHRVHAGAWRVFAAVARVRRHAVSRHANSVSVYRDFHQSAYTGDSKSAVVDFVGSDKNGTRTGRGICFRD